LVVEPYPSEKYEFVNGKDYPVYYGKTMKSGYDVHSLPWKIHPFLIAKPSISMGHLYHGYVSHNQRVYKNPMINITSQPHPILPPFLVDEIPDV
jgi:hypothetical protein